MQPHPAGAYRRHEFQHREQRRGEDAREVQDEADAVARGGGVVVAFAGCGAGVGPAEAVRNVEVLEAGEGDWGGGELGV